MSNLSPTGSPLSNAESSTGNDIIIVAKPDEIDKVYKKEEIEEDFKGADDENTEELGDKQKNIIWQIIGQLKIGMDLTKVLIPVDFLEDRSLLEKLTDFITHCNIVCSYVNAKDFMFLLTEYGCFFMFEIDDSCFFLNF